MREITGMRLEQSPFHQFKELLIAWTNRTIRARYQQSLLGWLWAVVQPVASVAIFSVIFTYFVPVDTGSIPYPVFSYIAVAPWAFFSSSLQDMTISLTNNISLVTKVYFLREALPLSAMLARLLDFGVASLVLLVLMILYQVPLFLPGLIYLPLILAVQILLTLGLGLITSATNVFFRDVQPLLTLGIQLWFYASPIIYPASLVPEQWRTLYFLNPMAGILESYRAVLLRQSPPDIYLLVSAVEALVLLIFGYWLFKKVEFQFADII
jgi:lipopolysaccharide transport system permease protein